MCADVSLVLCAFVRVCVLSGYILCLLVCVRIKDGAYREEIERRNRQTETESDIENWLEGKGVGRRDRELTDFFTSSLFFSSTTFYDRMLQTVLNESLPPPPPLQPTPSSPTSHHS